MCGCAGAVHRLPQISNDGLGLAQTEVKSAGGAPPRRAIADEEANEVANAALRRIRPSAGEVCWEMKVGVCTWQFRASTSSTLNASSGPNGLIVINRGILEYAANEEEVAMVIAHEIGHQAANHIVTGYRNQMVGALVGAVLLGALAGVATRNSTTVPPLRARQRGRRRRRRRHRPAVLLRSRSAKPTTWRRGSCTDPASISTGARLPGDDGTGVGPQGTGMLDTHPRAGRISAGIRRWRRWASNGRLPQRARPNLL